MSLENDLEIWMSDKEDRKRKTYLEDFLEKFPGAEMDTDGTPKTCRMNLYGDEPYEVEDNGMGFDFETGRTF